MFLAHVSLLMVGGGATQAALAQLTPNSVQVGGRVASFQLPAPKGPVIAAIIFERGDPASEQEARTIERTLGDGLSIGAMQLRPRRVATDELERLAGARVAFVTKGINYRSVARAIDGQPILTIGSDTSCVYAGHCAVAITSGPKVQIFVSREACRAAGIRFSSAFLMLVKEV